MPIEQSPDVAVFSDPAGHPFCLYADNLSADDEAQDASGDHPLPGRVGRVVIDCFSLIRHTLNRCTWISGLMIRRL